MKKSIEDKLIDAAIKFLEQRGWKVIVISVDNISQRDRKYNFSLQINFTGRPPNEKKKT